MKVFEANIDHRVSAFLIENLKNATTIELANKIMYESSGIKHFFESNNDLETLKETISGGNDITEELDRTEYGDFQTNADLANRVALFLAAKENSTEIVVEPTCGKGNFIIAALQNFESIKHIFGVEIYKPYIWETKFNLINFFLANPQSNKPDITITHCNVFDYDFDQITELYLAKNILIIGNPPWVTNSKLGSLNSSNLPLKSNFKNHRGLDAITGKGSFDIAENVTLTMLNAFQKMNGHLLLLVKNSVIKNIVFGQEQNRYRIANIEKYGIDSRKEFNVSVEASLFYCQLNATSQFCCKAFNFYTDHNNYQRFGWLNHKFVSHIDTYNQTKEIDGKCPLVWRQGVKHDCSAIMELNRVNEHYVNGLNEEVTIEETLVYGILKSSDLKNTVIEETRKYTIITQKKVGQDTQYIKSEFPKTFLYLTEHAQYFAARKSRIYKNKPVFSIFGIGDYSFKPFKVAISGLYKTFHFTLILPQHNKPVMLDDTCYFIGFDEIEFAVYALILLNSGAAKQFLQSITFTDAKRTFTKDVLMRIDLLQLAKNCSKFNLESAMHELNDKYKFDFSFDLWDRFLMEMTAVEML